MKNRFLFSLLATILLGIGIVWFILNANRWLFQPNRSASNSTSRVDPSPSSSAPAWTMVPIPSPTSRISVGPYVGQLAPDFSLKTLAGEMVKLEDYRGKVVLLNFWASWCIPCKEEMPLIQAIFKNHQDHGLVVLGINMTSLDERTEIKPFIQDTGITFPVILDEDGSVSELYRIISIPTSFFIDRSGIIQHFQLGAMTARQMDQYLEEMLP